MIYKLRSLFLILIIFIACPAISQQEYRQPPAEIIELADAPQTPAYSISPDKKFIAFLERREYPPIQDIAKPELRLAGIRIDPSTNGISKPPYFTGINFMEISTGREINPTGLPDRLKIRHVDWSPDSKYISFTLTRDNGIELWIIDLLNFNTSRLTSASLNEIMGKPYSWISNGNELLVKLINPQRGLLPDKPSVPDGPVILENTGKIAPARTYQDLLKNEFDEILFYYYAASRLAIIDLNANLRIIGEPGIFNNAIPSPDGKFILTEKIIKPYSYLVPYYFFPAQFEVIDKTGNSIAKLTELPLAEDIPVTFGSVRKGKRIWGWRSDVPSELFYVMAKDSGDASMKTNVRDKIFLMKDPLDKQPVEIASTEYRFRGIHWGNSVKAVLNESWWSTRRYKTSLINPSMPGEAKILFDRSTEDVYNDPGSFVLEKNQYGEFVLKLCEEKFSFLNGRGSSPEGDMPFLDRFNLDDLVFERLWRSSQPFYENIIDILDERGERILISKESASSPPNLYIENLISNTGTALTNYENPYKSLQGITKEIIQYSREDGVKLNAVLYLPPGYEPSKGRMPVLMWAYPQEFKSSDAAGQIRGSEHRFARLHWGSPLFWLTQGYIILDNPSMPVIGELDKEPNDTYIEQLVMNAKAAIDELVRRGIADPHRIAIGGHSYGAFMTANLLAHSDLFAAGIARSGAYNRTLTPFGFQAEQRTIWQSPETYINMSPFMFAHKINEPVLIIHGMEDSNPGTYPMQSERLYNALKGHGATARLVMLPFEDHGYQSRESILHVLAEQHDWLEKYVKNKR